MVKGETTSTSYTDNNNNNGSSNDQGADFECNICFELAQDPIVTLCGHLFCWPCLYRWLHHHSHSQECPVCKALVQEDKLVPLYGRGKNGTDPRSKNYPGMEIPNRPNGQRPETAAAPRATTQGEGVGNFFNYGIGLMGGFMPMASARIGGFSIGVGGLLPALLNLSFNGYPEAAMYGSNTGYGGYQNGFRGVPNRGEERGNEPRSRQSRQSEAAKNLFLMIGILVVVILCW